MIVCPVPFMRPGAGGGPAPYSNLVYRTAPAINTGSGSGTRTFSTLDIGTAAADRYVIAFARASGGNGITGCTIGGITGVEEFTLDDSLSGFIKVYTALVPSGTTATIVVTVNGAGTGNVCLGYWTAQMSSGSAVDSTSDFKAPGGTVTLVDGTLNIPENGFCIGVSILGGTNTDRTHSINAEFIEQQELAPVSSRQYAFSHTEAGGVVNGSVTDTWASSSAESKESIFVSFQ